MKKQREVLRCFAITIAILFMLFGFTACPPNGGGTGSGSETEKETESGTETGTETETGSETGTETGGNTETGGETETTPSNKVTVTFLAPKGCDNASDFPVKVQIDKGSKLSFEQIPIPEKAGCVFFGWNDSEDWTVDTLRIISEDLTCTADMSDDDYIQYKEVTGGYACTGTPPPEYKNKKYAFKNPRAVFMPDQYKGKDIISIEKKAFAAGRAIHKLRLGNKVKEIKYQAFRTTSTAAYMKELVLPASVEKIGEDAFMNCGIQKLVLNEGLKEIGDGAFASNDMLEVKLPDGLKVLGESAFYNNKKLTKVVLHSTLEKLPENVFKLCEKLKEINLPDGLTDIGDYAFSYCSSLENIAFPKKVKKIGRNAFEECTSLKTVVIPDTVESIGKGAFQNCKAMTSVTLGNQLNFIGAGAFRFCCLKKITIPGSIKTVEWYAFSFIYDGTNKIEITVNGVKEKPTGWDENWAVPYGENKKLLPVANFDNFVKVSYQP